MHLSECLTRLCAQAKAPLALPQGGLTKRYTAEAWIDAAGAGVVPALSAVQGRGKQQRWLHSQRLADGRAGSGCR
ncbi:MAG TPA: hypothetical protein VGF67_22225 [Ktedonobacteraceae bacterium]|jgi:hypothetical protein